MAAVAFAPPNSSLHCMVNESSSELMLDVDDSSFYVNGPWRNETTKETLESLRTHHPTTTRNELFHYDHPTVSVMNQLSPNNNNTQSIARLLPNDVNLDSWQKTYPEQWTCEDVLNLIYFIAMQSNDIEFSNFYGEKFQDVTGSELCSMTEEDFVCRDPKYGKMLHRCIGDLLSRSQFHPPDDMLPVKQEKQDLTSAIQTEIPITVEEMTVDELCSIEDLKPSYLDVFGVRYDIDHLDDFSHIQTTGVLTTTTTISGANSAPIANEIQYSIPQSYQRHNRISSQLQQHHHHQSLPHHHHLLQQQQQHHHHHSEFQILPDSTCINVDLDYHSRDACDLSWLTGVMPRHPNPEVTSSDVIECNVSSDGESSSGNSNPGTLRRLGSTITTTTTSTTSTTFSPHDDVIIGRAMNGGKGNHLWEFLCQQLRQSETIPTRDKIIQWESRDEGVFRIIDSKEVATQWGLFKGNDKMTYEKLSRALRWCRTNGFLASLPKDGKFPKKLCFRFGPKATNWRDFL